MKIIQENYSKQRKIKPALQGPGPGPGDLEYIKARLRLCIMSTVAKDNLI